MPDPDHYGAANDLYNEAHRQLGESVREGMAGNDFAAKLAMENAQLVASLAQTQALLAIAASLTAGQTDALLLCSSVAPRLMPGAEPVQCALPADHWGAHCEHRPARHDSMKWWGR